MTNSPPPERRQLEPIALRAGGKLYGLLYAAPLRLQLRRGDTELVIDIEASVKEQRCVAEQAKIPAP